MECQARGKGGSRSSRGDGQASLRPRNASVRAQSKAYGLDDGSHWPCLSGHVWHGLLALILFCRSPSPPLLLPLLVARCGAHMQHLQLFVALIVASPLADYGKS